MLATITRPINFQAQALGLKLSANRLWSQVSLALEQRNSECDRELRDLADLRYRRLFRRWSKVYRAWIAAAGSEAECELG